ALRGLTKDAITLKRGLGETNDIGWNKPEAVPALMQVLMAEAADTREVLAEHLAGIDSRVATEALAQLAVFDLSPDVRKMAVSALAKRPARHYRPPCSGGSNTTGPLPRTTPPTRWWR